MKYKLSQWHPGTLLPSRKGVYQMDSSGETYYIYSYFDGKKWYFGSHTLDKSINAANNYGVSQLQNVFFWRGIVK